MAAFSIKFNILQSKIKSFLKIQGHIFIHLTTSRLIIILVVKVCAIFCIISLDCVDLECIRMVFQLFVYLHKFSMALEAASLSKRLWFMKVINCVCIMNMWTYYSSRKDLLLVRKNLLFIPHGIWWKYISLYCSKYIRLALY